MMFAMRNRWERGRWAAMLAGLLGAGVVLGGCNIIGFVGAMAESYKRTSKKEVPAEYDGLRGKNIAVLVSVDRTIQGQYPNLVQVLSTRIIGTLGSPQTTSLTGITGFVPVNPVLEYQFSNPGWPARNYTEIAEYFSTEEYPVERLIIVDVYEFRLHEPGNAYVWDGVAAAQVGVVEIDGPAPNEFAFVKDLEVTYPDGRGYSRQDIPEEAVYNMLVRRLVDRVTWLFYLHEEDYYPEY